MSDAAPLRLSERQALIDEVLIASSMIAWLSPREPLFLHWDRMSQSMRDRVKQLKSSDFASMRFEPWMAGN